MSDIIQEIRSGNKEAVKTVYQQYAKDVYNFAKSITGDHDTALAATKKTFMTLFRNIQQGDEPANIRTAALKIAYDEAYSMVAPKEEPAPEPAYEEPAPEPAYEEPAAEEPAYEEPAAEEPVYEDAPREEADVYAEPMFQRRAERRRPEPVYDEFEEEYDEPYEEEDDGFVPPQREKDKNREELYIPKGGFDTLKIDPIPVEEEQEEMRTSRINPIEDTPRKNVRRSSRRSIEKFEEQEPADGAAMNEEYDEDYDDYDDEKKPRNKGLFIFCIILNIVLILILLWFLGGLLVNLGVLPNIDLGYSWFNVHIYPLF